MLFGLEPSDALRVFLWTSRLWPILAPLAFFLVLRRRIRKPLAFFVFGALACYGIHAIVGQIFISLPYDTPASPEIDDQLLHIFVAAMGRTIVVSILVGIVVLYWLYRVHTSMTQNTSLDSDAK
jgi:hypothetical protein